MWFQQLPFHLFAIICEVSSIEMNAESHNKTKLIIIIVGNTVRKVLFIVVYDFC